MSIGLVLYCYMLFIRVRIYRLNNYTLSHTFFSDNRITNARQQKARARSLHIRGSQTSSDNGN